MYPNPWLGPLGISLDIHPVTVTKVAVVTNVQNAIALGGFALNSAASSVKQ